MPLTIWGFRGRQALLRMHSSAWEAMIEELGLRGRGSRESGTFLLADRAGDGRTVTRIVYLDDLDPDCLTGGIEFNGLAFSKLWDICDAEERVVIGDAHTHPGTSVRQSDTDAQNPMVAQKGHIALIIPNFASRPVKAREVGVHQYDGNTWHTWTGQDAAQRLFIRRLL